MRNKLTIGAFLLMLTAFIVVLALPADEESIKSENRVMATIPPVNEETVFSGEFETGFESFIGENFTADCFRRFLQPFPADAHVNIRVLVFFKNVGRKKRICTENR